MHSIIPPCLDIISACRLSCTAPGAGDGGKNKRIVLAVVGAGQDYVVITAQPVTLVTAVCAGRRRTQGTAWRCVLGTEEATQKRECLIPWGRGSPGFLGSLAHAGNNQGHVRDLREERVCLSVRETPGRFTGRMVEKITRSVCVGTVL